MDSTEPIHPLEELDLSFPLRTNISFMLSDGVRKEVRKLNSIIVKDGFAEIDFSAVSAPLPHITLLMGEVDHLQDLKTLIQALTSFSQHQAPIDYRIGKPYLRDPSRNFIFVDTVPQEQFRLLRLELDQILSRFIDCDMHGGPKNVSHITLGYAHGVYPGIQKLVQVARPVVGVAETFQVAETGIRGTCRRLIARISK